VTTEEHAMDSSPLCQSILFMAVRLKIYKKKTERREKFLKVLPHMICVNQGLKESNRRGIL
jgi:hypothetical protein